MDAICVTKLYDSVIYMPLRDFSNLEISYELYLAHVCRINLLQTRLGKSLLPCVVQTLMVLGLLL